MDTASSEQGPAPPSPEAPAKTVHTDRHMLANYVWLDLDRKRHLERDEWALLYYDRCGVDTRGGERDGEESVPLAEVARTVASFPPRGSPSFHHFAATFTRSGASTLSCSGLWQREEQSRTWWTASACAGYEGEAVQEHGREHGPASA